MISLTMANVYKNIEEEILRLVNWGLLLSLHVGIYVYSRNQIKCRISCIGSSSGLLSTIFFSPSFHFNYFSLSFSFSLDYLVLVVGSCIQETPVITSLRPLNASTVLRHTPIHTFITILFYAPLPLYFSSSFIDIHVHKTLGLVLCANWYLNRDLILFRHTLKCYL